MVEASFRSGFLTVLARTNVFSFVASVLTPHSIQRPFLYA